MTARVKGAPQGRKGALGAITAYLHTFVTLHSNARWLLLGNLCLNIGLGVYAVLFNLYIVGLGYNVGYVGLLSALSTIGQAAIAPLVGLALRRTGERWILMIGAAGMTAASALSALATNSVLLAVLSALTGAGFAVATIPALPYMMTHASTRQRTHLFSAYFASNTLGGMIGSLLSGSVPALALALLRTRGQRAVIGNRMGLIVGVVIMCGAMFCFWAMRAEPPSFDSLDRPARPGVEVAARDDERTRRDIVAMLIPTTIIALTMGATMPFFNVYFATRLHASTASIGGIFAASGIVCAVAALLAPVAGRWGRLAGFNAARILTAPAFLVFWLNPGLGVAAVAYIVRNTLGTVSGALENTYAMEILPARLRGMAASARSLAFNGGWSVGALAAGVAAARFGYDTIFLVAAILTIAGSIVYYAYFARRAA